MKIIFWGTPDFAVPSLKILLENNHQILAVVTSPDKERGRGQKVTFTAVKEFAIQNHIPVLQPDKLKAEDFINNLKAFDCDVYVVVAFKILPREIFTIPKFGSFNLHASLLPKFRGAAPIQWTLIKGETETGVTTFALEDKVDTGNIYLQKKIQILSEDNFGTLHNKLSLLGAEVVLETVNLIENGTAQMQKQSDELASPAPKITKENMQINWNESAEEIHNLVRAFSPFPGAFFTHQEKLIKVYRTRIDNSMNLAAGKILEKRDQLFVGCSKGSIEILEIQSEGRKKMTIAEFLRGHSFSIQ
ncbi:MAG: methionyl-tRNA formyltransferase [Ignavibacteria bacterium RIFOXYB2_FULL_35_12]|nr:MAG: methionyl-tRNA formyltransferase [Ignavibacteria bacterium GWA2_36_19]OGU59694.1 MAG: methionyl-tRNA formyltransferase [Ignavibacteria bacterium GWF2_35_20]OGU85162.1 MAG: methionyl-tRNA formyltransferase [Ignavibacteria bacterium RIFOXYA12_FULL_35_25]OGU91827.1 MAG: methionyl-tRNA formyltransferase [Ignavibacteria bacterium RIFOXYC12_FULL_35_11]OGU97485.1 MAG: methionyl-tRNA formyltransferase [Ignavibacteria bacterium RIFOXYB12_FULL_35_14]OGV01209.1 MAG: methionyl-tRNA formyltransfera